MIVSPVRFAVLLAGGLLAASPVPAAAKPAHPAPATRIDPYKNFRFRLEIDGRAVAGMSSAAIPAVVKHRNGGDPSTSHKSPGRNKFEPITLERGLTQDSNFAAWAASGPTSQGRSVREVRIVAVDEGGRPTTVYRVHRAWVSEYNAAPKLDGSANAVAIEHIRLENEGWER